VCTGPLFENRKQIYRTVSPAVFLFSLSLVATIHHRGDIGRKIMQKF